MCGGAGRRTAWALIVARIAIRAATRPLGIACCVTARDVSPTACRRPTMLSAWLRPPLPRRPSLKGKWRHWQRWNLTRIPESKRAAKREKFHATDPSLQHSRKILRAGWAWIETPCEEHAANLLKIRRPPDPFISYFMALVAADMDLTGAVETVVGSSRTYCKTDVLRRSIRSCVVRWALTGVAPVPAEQVTE